MLFEDYSDLGPIIVVWGWVWLSICSIFFFLRLYCKHLIHRCLRLDDWALLAAWVFVITAQCLYSYAAMLGLGQHQKEVPAGNLSKILLINNFAICLIFLALIWSKTSFAMTLLPLTGGWTRSIVWLSIASTHVFISTMLILFWVQCTPVNKIWHPEEPGTCLSQHVMSYYGFVAAIWSGMMDGVLAFLPWKLLCALPLKPRERAAIAFAMSLGILAGLMAVMRATGLLSVEPTNFTHSFAPLILWATAETACSINAASIPALRGLFRISSKRASETRGTRGGVNTIVSRVGLTSQYSHLSDRNSHGSIVKDYPPPPEYKV